MEMFQPVPVSRCSGKSELGFTDLIVAFLLATFLSVLQGLNVVELDGVVEWFKTLSDFVL